MTYKDIKEILRKIINALDYVDTFSNLPDCNSCSKQKNNDCGYAPKIGEFVRINCPLYENKKGDK